MKKLIKRLSSFAYFINKFTLIGKGGYKQIRNL